MRVELRIVALLLWTLTLIGTTWLGLLSQSVSNTLTNVYLQDLVKSHLMSAVRSEVEELREKIAKLEVSLQLEQFEKIENFELKCVNLREIGQ